jgi:hypothetical protein
MPGGYAWNTNPARGDPDTSATAGLSSSRHSVQFRKSERMSQNWLKLAIEVESLLVV